ncbi:MAG: MFS transporter, partial [Spirochaetales bacterium]|nr:MFS transporter [Spirochaetales bacterium]
MATIVPYLQQILKAKGFQSHEIGFLLGIFEVTGVLGPLMVGWFADRVGKYRLILLVLTVTSGVSFFFLSYRVGFASTSIILVFFGLMYRPIASLTDALASRALTDAVKQYGRARIWGSIGYVGISFFYQAWGYLDSTDSLRVIFVFSILMAILFFSSMSLPKVPGISVLPETRKKIAQGEKTNIGKVLVSIPKIFWVGIGAAFLIKLSMSGYYSFFSIYLTDVYKLKGISGVWGLGALAEIPVILWGSRYVVKYGIGRMISIAALGTVLRMVIYA